MGSYFFKYFQKLKEELLKCNCDLQEQLENCQCACIEVEDELFVANNKIEVII